MLYMCISTYIGNAELNIQEEQANWQALFSSKSKPYVIECYFVSRHFCGWTYRNCLNFNNSWFTYLRRFRFPSQFPVKFDIIKATTSGSFQ